MQLYFRRFLTFIASGLMIYFSGLSLPISANPVVRITNGEWPPYLSEHLPDYGFASKVVSEAYKAVGINVEYGFFPWKRAYRYAEKGKGVTDEVWHATLVWVYTEERAKSFIYSDPVVVDIELLFHLVTRPLHWQTVDDLKGKTIGGTLHTVYPIFEEAESRGLLTIQRAGNYDILFDRLIRNRIDAVPQVKEVGNYFLDTTVPKPSRNLITFSPTVIEERKYHVIFSKKIKENQRLVKLLNEGLKILKDNGRYAELLEQLRNGRFNRPN